MSTVPQPKKNSIDAAKRAALGEVDRSLRYPILFFVICSILWLIVSNALALITTYQSYQPDFLSNYEWLTYGRLYPIATNSMLFGWGCNVIFAVALWIIARLSLAPIRDKGILIIAGVFWNFGLKVGLLGILIGELTPVESLELPGYSTPILLIAYALIGVWGVMAFLSRKEPTVYVSQWYIIGAFFWFPWIYTIAQFMVVWFPARGVVPAIVSNWFEASFWNLWLTSIALATAYYLIPKILGRPIYSSGIALFGFCSLAFIGSWTGLAYMIGGPIPVWLSSTGIVASVMMIMAIGTAVLNLLLSIGSSFAEAWRSLALRFVLFGVCAYILVGLVGSVKAFHSVNEITHFTVFTSGYEQLLVYAFFSMILFGGLYFMVPRLIGRDWPSVDLVYLHFWGSAIGIIVTVLALFIGGLISGAQMNNAEIPFIEIAQSLVLWLKIHTIGIVSLAVGHLAFAINFFWMLIGASKVHSEQTPLVLESIREEGVL